MHTASLSPVLRSALNRCKPLSPDEERATASAIWLAREDAWRLVLADPTARSRAVAVLEATGRADVDEARVDAKDCRALLDALSTGDVHRIAVADKDDVVLRLAAAAIAPHLRASIRSCLVRLDAAVSRLERHNVALVVHVARRCYSIALGDTATRKANRKGEPPMRLAGAIELDDLVAWGMIHLRTAALRFDARRGLRFSTFAVWWIRHGIGRSLADYRHTIRIPVHVHEMAVKVRRAQAELEAAGIDPTNEAIARHIGVAVNKVATTRAALRVNATDSLSMPVGIDPHAPDASTLADILADDADLEADFADADEHSKRLGAAMRAMVELDERDQFVLDCRFGLSRDADEPDTLEDVGEVLGLSRERVRQIQCTAVQRVRAAVGAELA